MRYNENAQYEQTHPLVTRHSVGGTDFGSWPESQR